VNRFQFHVKKASTSHEEPIVPLYRATHPLEPNTQFEFAEVLLVLRVAQDTLFVCEGSPNTDDSIVCRPLESIC